MVVLMNSERKGRSPSIWFMTASMLAATGRHGPSAYRHDRTIEAMTVRQCCVLAFCSIVSPIPSYGYLARC